MFEIVSFDLRFRAKVARNSCNACFIAMLGLSANALKNLMILCGCPSKGNMTNKARAEQLLHHFQYSDDYVVAILGLFKVRKATSMDVEDVASEPEPEEDVDGRCEAELLSRLLKHMEEKEQDMVDDAEKPKQRGERQPRATARSPAEAASSNPSASSSAAPGAQAAPDALLAAVPWSPQERGTDKPDLDARLPAGCSLHLGRPTNASPFVQGSLPPGESYKKRTSISRSYRPESAPPEARSGRIQRSFECAKGEVVAWLWEWYGVREAGLEEVPAKRARAD